MAADRPAVRPPDTLKVRGRLRAAWLALWLAGAAGCVAVGLYRDTPEDTLGSHQIFLSLFLSLAAVSVVVAVRGFGRGLDADGNGVVVRNMLRAISNSLARACRHRVQRGGLSGHQRHVLPALIGARTSRGCRKRGDCAGLETASCTRLGVTRLGIESPVRRSLGPPQVLSVEATPFSQGGSTCISVPRQRQVSDFSPRWGKAGVSIGQPGRLASGRRLATGGSARPMSRIDAAGRAWLR
jgi:hypothetical protein